jgi:D-glycero-D-manno-heptose 1,7-bisphosphate phosphatase
MSIPLNENKAWTLFLDRDGVLNERIPGGYVTRVKDFIWLEDTLEALKILTAYFKHIIVVTNQQGIGKGLMTEEKLEQIHSHMIQQVTECGGRIDKVYHCSGLAGVVPDCRKPAPHMAFQAQKDFADIDFSKAVMVGDTPSDMEFAKNAGMQGVRIMEDGHDELGFRVFPSLYRATRHLQELTES